MANPVPLKSPNSARPAELGSPVPGENDINSAAATFMQKQSKPSQSMEEAAAQFMQKQSQSQSITQSSPSWNDVSGNGLVQGALNALPTIGAVAGGIAGSAAGPFGSIGGAAAGAVGGASLKAALEKSLGRGPQSRGEFYGNLAKEAETGAISQTIGLALPGIVSATKGMADKAIAKIGNVLAGVPPEATGNYLKAPQAVKDLAAATNGDLATAADNIRAKWSAGIDEAKGILEDPALKLMAQKTTSMSDAQVGDSIKSLIKQDVMTKYGPFQKAYAELEGISRATPIQDDARKIFQDKVRGWALDEFPQNSQSWNMIKKYTDSFSASNTGAQFDSVVGDLNDEITTAYRSGEVKKANILSTLKGKASDFMEGQVDSLAKRIQSGSASEDEIQFLNKIVEAQGIQEEEPAQYAKALAKDYLTNRAKIRSDYSGFKDFMAGLTDQTKVKSNGTMDFLSNLDSVPSEKLASKIFDVNNSAALSQMKEQTPQVFDQVSRYGVKQIMQDSLANGKLDVVKFNSNVQELPQEIRNLIFSPVEQKTLSVTVANPKYIKLNEVLDRIDSKLITPGENHNPLIAAGIRKSVDNRGLRDLGELSLLTNQNMIKDAQTIGAMKYFSEAGISRKALLKTSIDLATAVRGGINNSIPQMGPAGPQIQGRMVNGAASTIGAGINSLRGRSPTYGPTPQSTQQEESQSSPSDEE